MNSYDFAASNGITGTDAEVVAVLQSMSQSNIARDRLGPWLGQETELLYYSGNSWFGTLESMIQGGQITGDLLAGVNLLKAVVVGSAANSLRTSEPEHAPRIYATIQGIAAITPEDDDDLIGGFYSLDGGRPFAALTVDQFAADRNDSQRLARADQSPRRLSPSDPAHQADTREPQGNH